MPETLQAVHFGSGKVRELYGFGDQLLLVASDRISAFDVIIPTPIPDKGRVLTGLSLFWFERTAGLVPNHLVTAVPAELPEAARSEPGIEGRAMLTRRLTMFPIECVVRGYLAGSGWKEYRAAGAVCGHPLPAGLCEAEQLPEPIFTPATKAESGHDINIDLETAGGLIGRDRAAELERVSIALYRQAADYAAERGIIIADTKFEFGLDPSGQVVLGDEVLTPDSSRFWPMEGYEPGRTQPAFDKQYLRDWLETLDWDKTPPGPELPDEIAEGTRSRYVEAYELLTGEPFAAYLQRMGVSE
jgi:phosphoribosylaminoimidazole-succinocarboxamide synthase